MLSILKRIKDKIKNLGRGLKKKKRNCASEKEIKGKNHKPKINKCVSKSK